MKMISGHALCAAFVAIFMAGCAGGRETFSPSLSGNNAASQSKLMSWELLPGESGYKSLFSFNGKDGAWPNGALILVPGTTSTSTFYGTTYAGGRFYRQPGSGGTVFSITTTGTETVLHDFGKGSDAAEPTGPLTAVNGKLYGAAYGGVAGVGLTGMVFSITTAGKERVLYSFKGGADGRNPNGGLIDVNGKLYGTTVRGGGPCEPSGCGTVFSITTAGKERVLYRFEGGADGRHPNGGLIDVNGKLYGTTGTEGGGGGTVFSITTAGKERVLYRFEGAEDGQEPFGSLVVLNGKLYGTTALGGGSGCGGVGCGTVFSVTTTGQERVLHRFGGKSDGKLPFAGLTVLNDRLYGTTDLGGRGMDCGNTLYSTCGTVFSVTTAGNERVLYRFGGPPYGGHPESALTYLNGKLYGTTALGGAHGGSYNDSGTVFALTP